jgi:hypothetical protein
MKKSLFLLSAIAATATLSATAQQLFVTEDDWTGWNAVSAGSVTYSYVASPSGSGGDTGISINGLGNTGQYVGSDAGGAGNAGTAGVLGLQNASLGWNVAQSQNEQNNQAFLNALWGGDELVITYTLTQTMTTGANGYWQLVPIFNDNQGYNEMNNAGFFTSSALSAGTYTVTYDYTPSTSILPTTAGQDSYFQLLISANSGGSLMNGTQPYYIDDIQVVPEPTTLALAGLGGLSLLFLRRKK